VTGSAFHPECPLFPVSTTLGFERTDFPSHFILILSLHPAHRQVIQIAVDFQINTH